MHKNQGEHNIFLFQAEVYSGVIQTALVDSVKVFFTFSQRLAGDMYIMKKRRISR